MAFISWNYYIIYNNGVTSSGSFGASSRDEALSKAKATASISASAHKGVAYLSVAENNSAPSRMWKYAIIYNDGVRSSGGISARSREAAEFKARTTASISASAHKGVKSLSIS